jgi:hypothetical protein
MIDDTSGGRAFLTAVEVVEDSKNSATYSVPAPSPRPPA